MPLVVNVTFCPGQGEVPGTIPAMVMVVGMAALTGTTTLSTAVFGMAQAELEVRMTLTTELGAVRAEVVKPALSMPAFTPLTCH